jgi:hypothetical protein
MGRFRRTEKQQHNNLSNSIELKPRKKKERQKFYNEAWSEKEKITLKTTIKSKSDKIENNSRTINFILFLSVSCFGALSRRTKNEISIRF